MDQPLPKPEKSVTKSVAGNDSRSFSSFDDLADWAVKSGHASDRATLWTDRQDLWGDLLFKWYTQGQVGCVFATNLARDPHTHRWYTAVVEGAWTADMVTGIVDAVADSDAEALQLLFPGAGDVEQAIGLLRALGGHDRWQCQEIDWLEGEAGDSVQVGLRWIPPQGDYQSWALGIAPFETMPFTRRFIGAPFVALVLRPAPPMEDRIPKEHRKDIDPKIVPPAHLAHLDDGLKDNEVVRLKWWAGSKQAKRALISPEPMSRARAKVTFALPAWARRELEGVL